MSKSTITLDRPEIAAILDCIQIAIEDESIFPNEDEREDMEMLLSQVEEKLRTALR